MDDFLLITSGGGEKMKKDMLADIASPELSMEINDMLRPRVRVHQNTAVLTGILHQKFNYKGKHYDVKLCVTDTWIRTDGTWKLLSGHASPFIEK